MEPEKLEAVATCPEVGHYWIAVAWVDADVAAALAVEADVDVLEESGFAAAVGVRHATRNGAPLAEVVEVSAFETLVEVFPELDLLDLRQPLFLERHAVRLRTEVISENCSRMNHCHSENVSEMGKEGSRYVNLKQIDNN